MEKRLFVYVGSMGNRENRGCGEGVTSFELDPQTGAFRFVNCLEVEEPSVLAASQDGKYLYASNEMEKFVNRMPGTGGGVTAMKLDQETGSVSLINQTPALGAIPAYICLDNTGSFVCAAIHGSMGAGTRYIRDEATGQYVCRPVYDASGISLFRIGQDGRLEPGCDLHLFHEEGHSALWLDHPERAQHGMPGHSLIRAELLQCRSAIHSVNFRPDGLGVACDRGTDRIHLIRIDREAGRIQVLSTFEARIGVAPRHTAFHPTKDLFYLTNEIESSVNVYRINTESLRIEELQTIATIEENATFRNAPADIRVHPTGRFLYASNRGDNSIAVFRIDSDSGLLTRTQVFRLKEPSPRWFNITPQGKFLLVSNSDANRIVCLAIDAETGVLSFTGNAAEIKSPSCIAFAQIM